MNTKLLKDLAEARADVVHWKNLAGRNFDLADKHRTENAALVKERDALIASTGEHITVRSELHEALAAMTKELDEAKHKLHAEITNRSYCYAQWKKSEESLAQSQARSAEKDAQIERMRGALVKYGGHLTRKDPFDKTAPCASLIPTLDGTPGCSCGFLDALSPANPCGSKDGAGEGKP